MVCPPMFGVKGMDRAKLALLFAGATMLSFPVCAQVANDSATPPRITSGAVQTSASLQEPAPANAAPSVPTNVESAAAVQKSWIIIIQFTDRNDAYLRGQPAVPATQPRMPTIKDTIKDISQRFGIEYMGARYDPVTQTYMLRYMRNGEVVDFYVDARTNKVVGREGF
jgi:hypothetical protein